VSRWLNRFQPWGVLLLRLVLGTSMLYHGWEKVIPSNFPHGSLFSALHHNAHFVANLGLPAWLGYVSALTEFVGGFCLILGLFTRLFAGLVAINMLVAIFAMTIHRGYGASELPLAMLAIALMLLFSGAGKAALDRRTGFA
jgi:putative oxidoreductase